MSPEALTVAVEEARRFMRAAEQLLHARTMRRGQYDNPREQGTVKRASLDLTRSLADLRRS